MRSTTAAMPPCGGRAVLEGPVHAAEALDNVLLAIIACDLKCLHQSPRAGWLRIPPEAIS